ncbi:MAG: hypothetical protein COT71_04475 [Candidatus Andersenbacteria bacterium CG10_big_fil_rev_8_21_14_0_10_54_11]|uniref:Uncharacterized protein n=1 Tax=Candidatus Andersenbacteria bacterium CG10_big_fil_rev_8_21_14_0_10_54_11 TaxID=1974485 RepID=A0A2M6WYB7_9BACT|nr:MAG: hypothetical protein COT71_04475 [Candidatus Andersenbacteria bacterium CG10_big_fil_rev_8_21_14_0_10_54_11]
MAKIMTILKARVNQQKWGALRNAYRAVKEKQSTSMPLTSFLLQRKDDPTLWTHIYLGEYGSFASDEQFG